MSATIAAASAPPNLVSTALVAVSAVFPALSLLSLYGRFKARSTSKQGLKADDWWLLSSWIATLSLSINVWAFAANTGIDRFNIGPVIGTEHNLKCLWLASVLVQVANTIVKIGILLFYKRLFPKKAFQATVWVALVLVVCWGIVISLLVIFLLDPVSASWTGKGHMRYDAIKLGMAQAGSSIALDVVILSLPLPIIFTLQMRPQRKVAVATVFWLGIFCIVAAIVRLVLLKQALNQVVLSHNFGAVYLQTKMFCFMIIEPNCSLVAANLPTYGPLLPKGRAPESLLASVRSRLSLRSRSSFTKSELSTKSKQSVSSQATGQLQSQHTPGAPDGFRDDAKDSLNWSPWRQTAATVSSHP